MQCKPLLRLAEGNLLCAHKEHVWLGVACGLTNGTEMMRLSIQYLLLFAVLSHHW